MSIQFILYQHYVCILCIVQVVAILTKSYLWNQVILKLETRYLKHFSEKDCSMLTEHHRPVSSLRHPILLKSAKQIHVYLSAWSVMAANCYCSKEDRIFVFILVFVIMQNLCPCLHLVLVFAGISISLFCTFAISFFILCNIIVINLMSFLIYCRLSSLSYV